MKSIVKALDAGRTLISDGAWGTLLHKRGLQAGECPELWNVTHRDDVFAVAKGYIDAGADIILTNSFGASPFKLKHYALDDRTVELNTAAAQISRQAAGSTHFVAGSVGPTGVMLMMGEVTEDVLYAGFSTQVKALADGGVDAFCIETMSAIDEACIAIRAAKTETRCEVICTFTFEKTVNGDYRTMMGVSPQEMVAAVRDAGADIIGTNCGNGIEGMVDIVKIIRSVDTSVPVLVHANAGKPLLRDGVTVFPETPDVMAAQAAQLVAAGASIIGGCCGTTPEHIAALADAVR